MFIYISNFADYFLSVQRTLEVSPDSLILSLVSCLLSPVLQYVSCLIFPIFRLLAPVSCLRPSVSLLLSPISNLPSPVSCLLSPVSRLPISHLLSPIYCLTSSVSCPTFPVSRLPCCYCCRYNLQYNHLADLTISWSKLADFDNFAFLTLLAELADYKKFFFSGHEVERTFVDFSVSLFI